MKIRMRNLKSLLLIAVFTLGLGGVANAQKMGHIDFEKLVAEMPATKQLKADIEKLGKTYQDEIEGMAKKLDAKMKKYTAEQNNQTKEINEIRAKEVQTDNQRYEQLRQTAYQEMQKKQAEGLKPIIEKAQKAIEEVAATKGILYVLDASVGKGLLVKKGEDLYAAVKAKLGF
jgi:outer membrane protein